MAWQILGADGVTVLKVDGTSAAARHTLYDQYGNPMSDVNSLGNVLNALNAAVTLTLGGQSTVGFNVAATTGSITLSFEATIDNVNWFALSVTPVAGGAAVTTTTGNGEWVGAVGGFFAVRARISSITGGASMTTSLVITPGGSTLASVAVSGSITGNQGTAAALAGAWPVEITDGTNVLGTATHPVRVDPTGTTTQPVSGTVTAQQAVAANLLATATQGPANTVANAWPEKITDGTNTAAVKAASTAAVATDPALVVAVSPNNTIPISAASLPLPTGAATSANLTTLGSQTTKINDGTNTAAVKAASTPAVVTDPALVIAVSPNNVVAVSATSFPLPTGAATAANQTTIGTQTTEINDGTHAGTIKAASTAAVATDTALVVAVSPNNTVAVTAAALPLPTGAATAANQTTIGTQTTEINDGTHAGTIKAASTAAVATDTALVVAVSPNNTVAVTAAALPLPTGAATAANQTTIGTQTTEINDGTHAGSIKAASTAAVATDTALVVAVSPNNTVAVTAAALPLPTGAATAANQTTLGTQTTEINDGTHAGTIKAASTAAVATDTALVVAVSPNNTVAVTAAALPLPTGAATAANQTTLGTQTTEINDGTHTAAVKAASTLAVEADPALVVALNPASAGPKASASTVAQVASSATSVTLLAANANRLGAFITNDSTQVLLVKLGTAATTTSYTAAVPITRGLFEVPFGYTGIITGIWIAANGNAYVTEVTP